MKINPKFANYNHPNKALEERVRRRTEKHAAEIIERKDEIIDAINNWSLYTTNDWAKGWSWEALIFANITINGNKPLALTYRGLAVYYGDMSPSDQEDILFEGEDLELINEVSFKKLPGYLQNIRTAYRMRNKSSV